MSRAISASVWYSAAGAPSGDVGFDADEFVPMPLEPLDRGLKSVEACAQPFHDVPPGGHSLLAANTPEDGCDQQCVASVGDCSSVITKY